MASRGTSTQFNLGWNQRRRVLGASFIAVVELRIAVDC